MARSRSSTATGRSRWPSRARSCRSCRAPPSWRADGRRAGRLRPGRGRRPRRHGQPTRTSSSSRPAPSCHWPWPPARSSTAEGIRTRVVSMPSWERFAAQPVAYRDEVLPPSVTARVSIEAGVSLGWDRWVGPEGAIIAIDRFGASAPAEQLFEAFGFTAEHVAQVARGVMTGDVRGVVSRTPLEHAGADQRPTPLEADDDGHDQLTLARGARCGHRRRGHRARRRRALGEPPLGPRHHALDDGPRRRRDRSPTGSAGSTRRPPSRPRSRSCTAFAEGIESRGLHGRRRVRHGRQLAGAGGARRWSIPSRTGPPRPRARLDRPRGRGRRGRRPDPRAHAAHHRHQVRHARPRRSPSWPTSGSAEQHRVGRFPATRPATASWPSPTRAAPLEAIPHTTSSARRSSTRPTWAVATAR